MKKGLFNKRIPTLIALAILLIVIVISTLLIQSGVFYIGKAAPDTQPLNFSITNINDTSFTVTFTTLGLVDSRLSMDNAAVGNTIILDDRDKKTNTNNKYYSHHITVPNLSPETTYTFSLLILGKVFTDPAFSVTTRQPISNPPPAQNPLFGKILLPDGSVGSDTIVTAVTQDTALVSAVSDEKGEFILPTNSLRHSQKNEYTILKDESSFTLLFYRQSMTTKVSTTFKTAQNLPQVTLLQQYSFVEKEPEKQKEDSQLNFTSQQLTESAVSIRRPEEGEEFVDRRPSFFGTSFPNSSVDVLIPGIAQQQVLTGADGLWTFQPSNNIPQGDHSLIININDALNEKITLTRNFTIFPLGSQVTESATPSATPKAQPSPTRTPTPTPSTIPTIAQSSPTPTIAPSPTLGITMTPTSLPTIYFTPTSTPTIIPPGAFENTTLLTSFSIILIVAGLALLLAL